MFDNKGESGPPWGVPFGNRAHQPVLHDSSIEKCPDEFQHTPVSYPLGHPSHQHIVVDPVEELLQINIHNPTVAVG